MAIKVLTKEDLEDFKKELLEDIKGLFHSKVSGQKQWLRSAEVREWRGFSQHVPRSTHQRKRRGDFAQLSC